MSVREEGEFELILGNRQLLSVLFIVVVLLGVFFAMGFLAGRSTSGSTAIAKGGGSEADPPRVVEPAQTPAPPAAEPKPQEQAAVSPAPPQPQERPAAKPAETEPAAPPPAPAVSKPASASGYIETPPPGTYLQAAATRRADAESMLGLLRQDGLSGYVTPSPKPEMYRVLIGPLADNEIIAVAREKLANRGIKSPYIVKY
jgi:cell division septation protein DedD